MQSSTKLKVRFVSEDAAAKYLPQLKKAGAVFEGMEGETFVGTGHVVKKPYRVYSNKERASKEVSANASLAAWNAAVESWGRRELTPDEGVAPEEVDYAVLH